MRTNSLEHHLHLMAQWPDSWMGDEEDLPAGSWLIAAFEPFVRDLHHSTLSRGTIRLHLDHLWLLGGEIIRDLSMELEDDASSAVMRVASSGVGPLVRHADVSQARFNATCRRLGRYLEFHPLPPAPTSVKEPCRGSRRRPPAKRKGRRA
jgi:hypothetical protein